MAYDFFKRLKRINQKAYILGNKITGFKKKSFTCLFNALRLTSLTRLRKKKKEKKRCLKCKSKNINQQNYTVYLAKLKSEIFYENETLKHHPN